MKAFAVDSGFLIATYDERDLHHEDAERLFRKYFDRTQNQLLVPWPILYETVSTRLVRNRPRIERLRRDWLRFERERRLILLDDQPLRSQALSDCFAETAREAGSYRSLSLCDRVVRAFLADGKLRMHCFLTFNVRDFVDVCQKHARVIVSDG